MRIPSSKETVSDSPFPHELLTLHHVCTEFSQQTRMARKANSTIFRLIWSVELIINSIAIGMVFFNMKGFLSGVSCATTHPVITHFIASRKTGDSAQHVLALMYIYDVAKFAPAAALEAQAYPVLFSPVTEAIACMFGALMIALTTCEYRAIVSDNVETMSAVLLGLLVGDLAHVYAAYKVASSLGGWSPYATAYHSTWPSEPTFLHLLPCRTNIVGVAIALLLGIARVAWFSRQPRRGGPARD
eukprot:975075-Pelagomonas_calceolata.AAC.1